MAHYGADFYDDNSGGRGKVFVDASQATQWVAEQIVAIPEEDRQDPIFCFVFQVERFDDHNNCTTELLG